MCVFLRFVSVCVQEMQLFTCAGERSGLCPGLGKETASGWCSEQGRQRERESDRFVRLDSHGLDHFSQGIQRKGERERETTAL